MIYFSIDVIYIILNIDFIIIKVMYSILNGIYTIQNVISDDFQVVGGQARRIPGRKSPSWRFVKHSSSKAIYIILNGVDIVPNVSYGIWNVNVSMMAETSSPGRTNSRRPRTQRCPWRFGFRVRGSWLGCSFESNRAICVPETRGGAGGEGCPALPQSICGWSSAASVYLRSPNLVSPDAEVDPEGL